MVGDSFHHFVSSNETMRLLRHLSELFIFVTHPFVATTNNQAERDLRPPVIARKV